MNQAFTSIPFKTKSDFTQVNGIAKFSAAGIILEFESKFLGLIGTGVKEVRLSVEELLDVKFRKGVLKRGASIEIRTSSYATLAQLPNKDGKLLLKLDADDVDRARDAVEKLNRDLVDYRASLPPTQTSVSSLFDESEDETKKFGQKPER